MTAIVQPVTVTDMRRDPKALLKRVEKEQVVPILVHSKISAAVVSVEELNRLHETIKELKHDMFVQETLESVKDYEENGGIGPFDEVDDFMNALELD